MFVEVQIHAILMEAERGTFLCYCVFCYKQSDTFFRLITLSVHVHPSLYDVHAYLQCWSCGMLSQFATTQLSVCFQPTK